MTTESKITKQYIEQNMLTVTGGLNCWETRKVKETTEELYLIYHNIEAPKCECGNKPTFNNFNKGYDTFCSTKCSNNSEDVKDKKKITTNINYGVDNPGQSPIIHERMKESCNKNYGTDYYLQSEHFKIYCNEKWGVDNPAQSPIIKENKIITSNIKWGYDHPIQSPIIKEQAIKTTNEKYGANNYLQSEYYKTYCNEKWGVDHHMQSPIIKDKSKNTCQINWGFDYSFQSPTIQEKRKETNNEKYGVDYYVQSLIFKEQTKATCQIKYGVDHHMQSGLFSHCGYKHKDYILPSGKVIRVQGYEPKLLDELLKVYNEDEIFTDWIDMPEFWYFWEDGSKHRYYPDVYIPKDNIIYEVKSSYTLEQTKKKGIYDLKKQSVIDAGFSYVLMVY